MNLDILFHAVFHIFLYVYVQVEEEGYFVSCIKYGGQVIGPPSFSIISLSGSYMYTTELYKVILFINFLASWLATKKLVF